MRLQQIHANPIYELELLPVLVAYICWRRHLVNCQTVFYLDNDAARAGLTKALGATQHAEAIAHRIMSLESETRNKPNHGTGECPLLQTSRMILAGWSANISKALVASDVTSIGRLSKCR